MTHEETLRADLIDALYGKRVRQDYRGLHTLILTEAERERIVDELLPLILDEIAGARR